jgi:hypothetical protein
MLERRCFVQFIHPGGEHRPDGGGLRIWNRGLHRRKFLKSRGRYLDRGALKEGEIVFWGEWERSRGSSLATSIMSPTARGSSTSRSLSTTATARGARTPIRSSSAPSSTTRAACNTPAGGRRSCGSWRLARSSCSAPAERRPASWSIPSSSSASSWIIPRRTGSRSSMGGSPAPTGRSRSSRGIAGPFQRRKATASTSGPRPTTRLASCSVSFPASRTTRTGAGSHGLRCASRAHHAPPHPGKKIARDLSLAEIGELWGQVVRQIQDQGISLGTYAELPSQREEGSGSVEDPDSVGRC